MRLHSLVALLGLRAFASASILRPRDYDARDYYVLEIDSSIHPARVALSLGFTHEGPLGELADHHVFSCHKQEEDVVHTALKERRRRKRSIGGSDVLDNVKLAQKQKLKPRMEKRTAIPPRPEGYVYPAKRQEPPPVDAAVAKQQQIMKDLEIADPIFNEQWHLYNPVQLGHDVNVTDVWMQGITGHNATVAIVDDGLDMYSDDLKDNYFAEGSYDFNDHSVEPKPKLSDDRHGTRCAGEVSAVKNDVCGVGVAWDSKIAGIRILSKIISDADEAIAMNYAYQHNQIYSCSWGPPDDGKSMDAPGILIKRAMLNAVQNGRGGLGSIYVFASGNGAANEDNCNFDGYTNSIYSITVGAIDRKGLHPYYSEHCSAQLVVTYSSGSGDAIHTTDVGTNTCYSGHGGTSAAAPLAAGIFALVLQIRPDLTWRDMQTLVMMTALPVDLDTGEWQTTTIGKKFSHTFGYGKIDTWATIEAAKTFKNVKPQAWYYSPWVHVNQSIPEGDEGLAVSLEVTPQMLQDANLERLEHVTVTMNVDHTRRGDISVDLISPDKIVSHLSVTRRLDLVAEGYVDWTFMSVVHWGESGVGTWTVIVKDTIKNEFNGTFVDWHLKLWGESIDATKATLLPMPSEHDDDDHDAIISSTTTVAGATTSVGAATTRTSLTANPTGHPDRPTKPTGSPTEEQASHETTTAAAVAATTSASSWLPSFFPTFGVGPKTQIWIYAAAALIIIFCMGMGVYLFVARRERLRNNPRDEWEFDLLEEDEAEGLNGGGKMNRKGGKRRAGELYDAFAAGSEDESDGDFSEGGAEREKNLYEDEESEGSHSSGHVIDDDDDLSGGEEHHHEKGRSD
ncbi:peptidase S8/S53 domain-containing protein [Amylocarpus encephaloides]|uniref:Peptidase S8/S53 domain-containing protein n=1 Tax=Amylocarpus encephaloides TaxID=45428 RepID=A0A9P7YID8_9HELO|nr:peptidase S8/S53 domain-containing protein [Amylocarpus encephaloides]